MHMVPSSFTKQYEMMSPLVIQYVSYFGEQVSKKYTSFNAGPSVPVYNMVKFIKCRVHYIAVVAFQVLSCVSSL